MIPLPTTEGVRSIGDKLWFEYHCFESDMSSDAELWYRSHQRVTIVSFAENDGFDVPTLEERCEICCPIVYTVKFDDGFIGDVFEDELLDSKNEFYCEEPPNRGK